MKELGELIRAARQQKGVSLEQASAETRIRRQYLDAIEDGDFRIFPGAAYATGFLRNYSTYLGLNQDEILQTYHAISPPEAISIAPATTVGVERLKRRARRKTMWLFASVLVVFLIAVLIQKYNSQANTVGKPPQPSSATSGSLNSGGHHGSSTADEPPQTSLHHPRGVIRVQVLQSAWMRVKVNGKQVSWGPMLAGTTHKWHGHKVSVSSHRGRDFRVWVDGIRIGKMGHRPGRVVITATPYTWTRHH
ncbi:MAG TPA: helix-turn-helix domain-containing protein [Chloroflexota bacterium]|jgi:transcriptional regulator with XRE-family HTH domain|nr:helix-turn-helix domain-containing protein [Chloroflexota bacterium]